MTRAPSLDASSTVRSFEPLSTTTISSQQRKLSIARTILRSSLNVMIVAEILIIRSCYRGTLAFSRLVNRGQLQDLELARAAGDLDLRRIADLSSHEPLADGRSGRNTSFRNVGFFGGHKLEGCFLTLVDVQDDHCRSQSDLVARNSRFVDHGHLAQPGA